MHPDEKLKHLLKNPKLANKLWLGSSKTTLGHQKHPYLSSGYEILDQQLHTHGWPLHVTTEIALSEPGIGELRLLTPALRELQQKNTGNILLIAPPLLPFAPALVKEGIDTSRLFIVQSTQLSDSLWVTEQALLADCCAAVISWTGKSNLNIHETRRLQLAAEKSNTWNILLRDTICLEQASASGLRISIKTNTYSQLEIEIIKQAAGWAGQSCTLSLHPHYENWQRLPAHLLPHYNRPYYSRTPTPRTKHRKKLDQDTTSVASVSILSSLKALRNVH